jgi:hypothetical protein
MSAFADVLAEQFAPVLGPGVVAQSTGTGKSKSISVAGHDESELQGLPDVLLLSSLMRHLDATVTSAPLGLGL